MDGRWNDWLIGTRLAAGAAGAQRSSVEPTRLARIHALLAMKVQSLDNPLPPSALAGLKEAFEAKTKAVDAFAAANAGYAQAAAELKRSYESFAGLARERAVGFRRPSPAMPSGRTRRCSASSRSRPPPPRRAPRARSRSSPRRRCRTPRDPTWSASRRPRARRSPTRSPRTGASATPTSPPPARGSKRRCARSSRGSAIRSPTPSASACISSSTRPAAALRGLACLAAHRQLPGDHLAQPEAP